MAIATKDQASSEKIDSAMAEALRKKGVNITPEQLKSFKEHFAKKSALDISASGSVSVTISKGQGSWSNTYHFYWTTFSGTAKITAPTTGMGTNDLWRIKVYDNYEDTTIWFGTAGYNQSVSFSYSTGFKTEFAVTVQNLSDSNFNGTLTVHISASG